MASECRKKQKSRAEELLKRGTMRWRCVGSVKVEAEWNVERRRCVQKLHKKCRNTCESNVSVCALLAQIHSAAKDGYG